MRPGEMRVPPKLASCRLGTIDSSLRVPLCLLADDDIGPGPGKSSCCERAPAVAIHSINGPKPLSRPSLVRDKASWLAHIIRSACTGKEKSGTLPPGREILPAAVGMSGSPCPPVSGLAGVVRINLAALEQRAGASVLRDGGVKAQGNRPGRRSDISGCDFFAIPGT